MTAPVVLTPSMAQRLIERHKTERDMWISEEEFNAINSLASGQTTCLPTSTVEQMIKTLRDLEMLARVNAPVYHGSPMYKAIVAALSALPKEQTT